MTDIKKEVPSSAIYTTVVFAFDGEPDRTTSTSWPGDIPRVGEYVRLTGRDTVWKVQTIQWVFNIEPSKGLFERAVVITMEKFS